MRTHPQAIVLVGPICAGKTTLARNLQGSLQWQVIVTSSTIARVSRERGLPESRRTLQDVGFELATVHCRRFARMLLEDHAWQGGRGLIVDGVRSYELYSALELEVAPMPQRLVYLDLPLDIRIRRARRRDSISTEELVAIEKHPIEAGIRSMRAASHYVADATRSPVDLAVDVREWLMTGSTGN